MERTQVTFSKTPTVTALICTCDRPDVLVEAVRSILQPGNICSELLVVDQSTDDRTEQAMRELAGDPRLRYIRDRRRGKGLALNLGLREATSDIVAITDDDCVVSSVWPAALVEPFSRHPRVAVSYGNVRPVPHDRSDGFIPTHVVRRDRHFRHVWQKGMARGIGANTAVRRDAALAMGGFDPELGPGGCFRACIDGDFTLRALLAGYEVYEVEASYVDHYGFRTWPAGRKLTRNAFYGIAAAHVKPLRCGRVAALVPFLYELAFKALGHTLLRALTLRTPTGAARVGCFLQGAVDGWRHPIDRATLTYVRGEESDAPAPEATPKGEERERVLANRG